NEQLDVQMKTFLANPGKGMRIDADGKRVYLSSIFNWFEKDFESRGGVLKFLQLYVSSANRKVLENPRVSYLDYNWKLNEF
ncbi:MAG: DUF547 domain-containing protein, partial [Nitrospinae bacterium]|nr:DUF547 domain-containing protein [Nitrospinota bacterium]